MYARIGGYHRHSELEGLMTEGWGVTTTGGEVVLVKAKVSDPREIRTSM